MFENAVRNYGNKTAIISDGYRLSYTELDEASNKLANALIGLGVAKGDRVAFLLPNCPEFIISYFGIIKTGAIAVPLDPRYRPEELDSVCDDFKPAILITDSHLLEPLIPHLSHFAYLRNIINVSSSFDGQFIDYREIMAGGSTQGINIEIKPEDIAQIAYTSGPTVRPHGAVLTHRSVVSEASMIIEGFQQTEKDKVILFALPLHHQFALVAVLMSVIGSGGSLVIVHGVSISSVLETIEREQATIFIGVPYVYALAVIMAEKEGLKNDPRSIRLWSSGGAPLLPDIARRFKKAYGADIVDVWGLTEAVCMVTCEPIDSTRKFDSVGKPMSGWEVKIVDDNGREMPVNQPGEIIVRGPAMEGYYHNPEATAGVIKDGWLYTGDIGKLDEDGYVYILGRKKNVIIRKGQNIYPEDIEYVLNSHPKVARAEVVSVPDELKGDAVKAIVSLKDGTRATEEELRRFCRQHMADFKLPTKIELL